MNTSRISRFVPPTITRWPEASLPRPAEPPSRGDDRGEKPGTIERTQPTTANPLAALFSATGRRPSFQPIPSSGDDDQPTLGRFVDVIA